MESGTGKVLDALESSHVVTSRKHPPEEWSRGKENRDQGGEREDGRLAELQMISLRFPLVL